MDEAQLRDLTQTITPWTRRIPWSIWTHSLRYCSV